MNKLKKILCVMFFLFIMCGTCFADVIMPGENPRNHGGSRYNYTTNNTVNTTVNNTAKKVSEDIKGSSPIVAYIVIGALILVIIFCTIMVIGEIVKNKEEKK